MVLVSSAGLLTAIEKVEKRIDFVCPDLLKLFVSSLPHLEDFIWSLKKRGLGYLN